MKYNTPLFLFFFFFILLAFPFVASSADQVATIPWAQLDHGEHIEYRVDDYFINYDVVNVSSSFWGIMPEIYAPFEITNSEGSGTDVCYSDQTTNSHTDGYRYLRFCIEDRSGELWIVINTTSNTHTSVGSYFNFTVYNTTDTSFYWRSVYVEKSTLPNSWRSVFPNIDLRNAQQIATIPEFYVYPNSDTNILLSSNYVNTFDGVFYFDFTDIGAATDLNHSHLSTASQYSVLTSSTTLLGANVNISTGFDYPSYFGTNPADANFIGITGPFIYVSMDGSPTRNLRLPARIFPYSFQGLTPGFSNYFYINFLAENPTSSNVTPVNQIRSFGSYDLGVDGAVALSLNDYFTGFDSALVEWTDSIDGYTALGVSQFVSGGGVQCVDSLGDGDIEVCMESTGSDIVLSVYSNGGFDKSFDGVLNVTTSNDYDSATGFLTIVSNNGSIYYDYTTPPTDDTATSNLKSVIGHIVGVGLDLFPDKKVLTTQYKYGFVFVTLFIVAIAMLIFGSRLGLDPKLNGNITLVVLIAGIFFFLSIGYIPVAAVVVLVLILLAIGIIKLKNGG